MVPIWELPREQYVWEGHLILLSSFIYITALGKERVGVFGDEEGADATGLKLLPGSHMAEPSQVCTLHVLLATKISFVADRKFQ